MHQPSAASYISCQSSCNVSRFAANHCISDDTASNHLSHFGLWTEKEWCGYRQQDGSELLGWKDTWADRWMHLVSFIHHPNLNFCIALILLVIMLFSRLFHYSYIHWGYDKSSIFYCWATGVWIPLFTCIPETSRLYTRVSSTEPRWRHVCWSLRTVHWFYLALHGF